MTLPPHFVKIRHYGLLSNRNREERLAQARAFLGAEITEDLKTAVEKASPPENATGRCPFCGRISLAFVREVDARSVNSSRILDSS
jgi:hypothetical protein